MMSPRPAHSKTHRFVEILAALALIYSLFDAWKALNRPNFDLSLLVITLGAVLLGLGFFFRPIRKPSWIALWVAGLASSTLHPLTFDGTLLCLLSAYLLFDSGWFAKHTLPVTVVMVGSLLVTQAGSLLRGSDPLWDLVSLFVLTDIMLGVLVVLFREELLATAHDLRPVIRMGELGLTPRETQVLHFLWSGLSQKEIAGDLGITHGRVRNILAGIYEKLGLKDGRELATLVHSHQILWPKTEESKSRLPS